MAANKLQQVALESSGNPSQPPFPGGWVLAVFDSIRRFAPACAAQHELSVSSRTEDRIKAGADMTRRTFDSLQSELVALVNVTFPMLAGIGGFTAKYVDEYFRLWKDGATSGPIWTKIQGFAPEEAGVLGRALWRDLILRVCYLESCDRTLRQAGFNRAELAVLQQESAASVYGDLIRRRKRALRVRFLDLANDLGLSEKQLYRVRRGGLPLTWQQIYSLHPTDEEKRLMAGIGWLDSLTRMLKLENTTLARDASKTTEIFFSLHRHALTTRFGLTDYSSRQPDEFRRFATQGENLLLHPGFEAMWLGMPDALWRAHLYALQFGRVIDLAQAYFRFAEPDSDRELERFFDGAERESGGCPYHWMAALARPNNTIPFPT